jgi:hypothetical protein
MTHAHVLEAPTEPLDDTRITDIAPGNPVENIQDLVKRPEEAETPAVEIDEAIMSSAREIGFDDADLEGLDQALIERMIATVDRRSIEAVNRVNPASAGVTGAGAAGPQPPAAPPVQPWQQQAQQPQGFKIELDDSYDDKLVQTLNQMNAFYQQQMEQLKHSLQQQQEFATVGEDPLTRWFDGQFSGLGEEYHSVFGKGSIDDTRPGSAEEQNRIELHRAFSALKQAYPTAKDDVLFQRALRASFAHVQDTAAKKKLAAQAKQRSQTTIGRPSGRKPNLNAERDPITGVSTNTIDDIQREINNRLNR